MTEAQIAMLGAYLSEPNQAGFARMLEKGGRRAMHAVAFFDLRDAFGVKPRASKEEAVEQIREAVKG